MTALGAVIEDLVKANNAVDIYEEYFAGKVCRIQLLESVLILFWNSLLVASQSNTFLSIMVHTHHYTVIVLALLAIWCHFIHTIMHTKPYASQLLFTHI